MELLVQFDWCWWFGTRRVRPTWRPSVGPTGIMLAVVVVAYLVNGPLEHLHLVVVVVEEYEDTWKYAGNSPDSPGGGGHLHPTQAAYGDLGIVIIRHPRKLIDTL